MYFFCPFSILITLLGKEGAVFLRLSCICLLAMHTLICVTFSLPPGVGGWLQLLLVALPGLFCLPFFKVFLGWKLLRGVKFHETRSAYNLRVITIKKSGILNGYDRSIWLPTVCSGLIYRLSV